MTTATTGKPALTTRTVGGKEYQLGPFRYYELGIISAWLAANCPAPVPKVGQGHDWIMALFSDVEGITLFLTLLFAKHQELEDGELRTILGAISPDDLPGLLAIAIDQADPNSFASADAEKGE